MKKVTKLDPEKKTLILLNNLGTPDAPTPEAVKPYLRQFLMDPEVITAPFPIRWALVNLIILNTRPKKSAHAYSTIWTEEGSPLLVYSQKQAQKLAELMPDLNVDLCMRYGNPSIEASIIKAKKQGFEQILFLPLYPQYSTATTRSSIKEFEAMLKKHKLDTDYLCIEEFCIEEGFIEACAKNAKIVMDEISAEHLIMSFHGIPEKMLTKNSPKGNCLSGDCCFKQAPSKNMCYRAHCLWTAKKIQEKLNLEENQVSVSFQSRLGPTKWLQPYTDATIESLATQGKKRVAIASPAFTADCLETLEELAVEGSKSFKEAGGEILKLVPAPNDDNAFIETLKQMVLRKF